VNKRIQELAEHCDFYVGNEHSDKSHEEQQRLFLEKFAQLIVKECLAQVDKMRDAFNERGQHIQAHGAFWAGTEIELHFGIEK
jgi:hypothetical protein